MPLVIDGYLIDVEVTGDHRFPGEATEFPVEIGSDISDHVRNKPIELSIEGVVSDTPIGTVANQRTPFALHSRDAYDFLRELRKLRKAVTVETSRDVFDDMVLTELSIPTSSSTGKALRFTGQFRSILFVTTDRQLIKVAKPRHSPPFEWGKMTVRRHGDAPSHALHPDLQAELDRKAGEGIDAQYYNPGVARQRALGNAAPSRNRSPRADQVLRDIRQINNSPKVNLMDL